MSEPVMSLQNLTRRFDTRGGVITAVDDVSFDLDKGDILCLVGESGSGKTTVARMAAGMLKPTSGSVLFEGQDIDQMSKRDFSTYRKAVQIIHQDPYASLNPVHTIGDILRAPLLRHKLAKGRREATSRVGELLELVDLHPVENFIDKYPHQLSGGQRQRISVARAMTLNPRVIIADEAVSMVDVSIRVSLLNTMLKLRNELGVTFLFITHDLAVVKYFAWEGTVGVMYVGKLIEHGRTPQLIGRSLHMSDPATVVERYVVRRSPMPSAIYGEWAQQARDLFNGGQTLDDPEGKQLLDQFNQFRPEQIIVTGPYTIDIPSITNAQFDMPKNDKSYYADTALFDKIVNFNGETDTISAVALSKQVDYATHGFAPATEAQMQETGIRVLRPPTYGGGALLFNFAQLPEFSDKKVRQALAHAINRQETGTVSLADSGVGVQYMTGMSDNLVPKWMPESAIAGLNQYEYDQEKAAALLQEAGWTKDGETWKKPDGSDAAYELVFPAEFADYSATGQNVTEQLTAFGFPTTARPITFTQIGIDVDQGKFQLAIQGWGSSTNPHPHFSYTTAFFTHNTLAVNNGGQGMAFPLTQDTEVAGTVDLEALTVASAEGLDEAQQQAQVTTIAQVFNELLNIIPLYERYGNNAALEGVRVAAWPADDAPILQNSPYADGIPTMLMFEGQLEPFTG